MSVQTPVLTQSLEHGGVKRHGQLWAGMLGAGDAKDSCGDAKDNCGDANDCWGDANWGCGDAKDCSGAGDAKDCSGDANLLPLAPRWDWRTRQWRDLNAATNGTNGTNGDTNGANGS